MAIDWTKYFDAIYCFHYCKYTNRKKEIDNELTRAGVLDSGIFRYWYTARTPFDMKIRDMMKPSYRDFYNERANQVTNLIIANYQLWNEALECGYKHILTLEDDIRLTQNLDQLQFMLDALPPDWDYVHFDRVLNRAEHHRFSTIRPGPYYYSNYTGGYWGMGFTAWSTKALELAVSIATDEMWPADYILENRDDPRLNDLKRYIPITSLVFQTGVEEAYYSMVF